MRIVNWLTIHRTTDGLQVRAHRTTINATETAATDTTASVIEHGEFDFPDYPAAAVGELLDAAEAYEIPEPATFTAGGPAIDTAVADAEKVKGATKF